MALPRGIQRLFRLDIRSRTVPEDVQAEIEDHVARSAERLVRDGWAPAAARAEAERRFGPRAGVVGEVRRIDERREIRAESGFRLRGFGQDLRIAARSLTRAPGYSLTAIATFMLGIGANVAVFSLLEGVVLRPLPFAEPERVVRIFERDLREGRETGNLTIADFRDWEAQSRSFSGMAAFRWRGATLRTADQAVARVGASVSAPFFDLLGVRPAMGRTFAPADEQPGAPRVVVLTHAAWQEVLGGIPDVIGHQLQLNGAPATVIGVLAASFVSPVGDVVDVWTADDFSDLAADPVRSRRTHVLSGFARLREGVALEAAVAELETIGRRLEALYPELNTGHRANPIPISAADIRSVRPVLFLTMGAVGLLLLLACANLANLVLARSLARGRELAVRAALGAGRARLARSIFAEQLVLALVGTVAGVGVAVWASRGLVLLLGEALPRAGRVGLDLRVLGFAAVLALATAVITGFVPAILALRLDLQSVLRTDGRGTTSGRRSHRVRASLVGVQVALAVLLAAGSGLVIRSLGRLLNAELGFSPDQVATFGAPLPGARYPDAESVVAFQDRFLARLAGLPGVEGAGAAYTVPMRNVSTTGLVVEGQPPPDGGRVPEIGYNAATPGYFEVLGIPLLAGRDFTERDRAGAPGVVIVNRSLERRFFPNAGAVGARVKVGTADTDPWLEIVGVVGDIRRASVDQDPGPELYYAISQDVTRSPVFVLRTTGKPAAILEPVRRLLQTLDPEVPLVGASTLRATVDRTLRQPRFLTVLLGSFAGLALALAAVGVHGVIAFLVAERTREIGVRRALGAGRASVIRDVLRRGMVPVATGLLVGLAGALAGGPLLRGLLYEVAPGDPVTLAVVSLVAVLAGLAGCLVPARRAVKVDPMAALRE